MYKFLFLFFMLERPRLFISLLSANIYLKLLLRGLLLKQIVNWTQKAFAIKNKNTGEVREFQHGEAFIKATMADELMVVLAEKFDQVSFEGEVVPVQQKLEIFQDCSQPVGIAGVFRSFNAQFSNN